MKNEKELTLGELIHSIRKCDELSLTKISASLGICPSYLHLIERGKRFLSIKKAAQFADVLCYSKEQFVELAIQDQLKTMGLDYKVTINKKAE